MYLALEETAPDDMKTAATHLTMTPRGDSVRRAMTWFLVIAFALQSYVTQIHIHRAAQGFGSPAIVKVLTNTPAHHGAPSENSGMDCPLCQAVAHAGVFFAPVTPLLPLPVLWVELLTAATRTQTADNISTHNWRSRAPPQH